LESRVNYTLVGLFVVILGIGLLSLAYWLSAGSRDKNNRFYDIYINESVSGLTVQAPVKFNGVDVGFVNDIQLNPKNPQQVRVTISVDPATPVSTSTIATLKSQGITGITYIGLSALTPNAKPLTATEKGHAPVIRAVPSLLVQLDTALRDVTENIQSISRSFRTVFDDENTKAIKSSLDHINAFTLTLANSSENIEKSLKSMDVVLKNSALASKRFPTLVKNLDDLTANLNRASEDVHSTIKNSRVMVQTLSTQALPSAVQLIGRLSSVANDLKQISSEVRRDPAVIIRGRQPEPAGPGER